MFINQLIFLLLFNNVSDNQTNYLQCQMSRSCLLRPHQQKSDGLALRPESVDLVHHERGRQQFIQLSHVAKDYRK